MASDASLFLMSMAEHEQNSSASVPNEILLTKRMVLLYDYLASIGTCSIIHHRDIPIIWSCTCVYS